MKKCMQYILILLSPSPVPPWSSLPHSIPHAFLSLKSNQKQKIKKHIQKHKNGSQSKQAKD